MIGKQIAQYQIEALLGAGGMGEVYRARDTKLKRDVAIKMLPEEFSRDPERVSRFQREAEVLASLIHPSIAAIYDLQEAHGSRYLVLELVEGETLADRIARGPIPVEEALDIAKNICEALEAAHEKGIIHRDLKPANVKITPEGKVKVLDFGLAKATEYPGATSDVSNSPTLTLGATSTGVILGTAAYMSPEQASGKLADRRADIWSFGAVLYEMLSGKQAFAGESVSDTLASVLKLDPDWSALPLDTPASIRTLVRRCLTKDRKQRLQAIGEARIVLENPPRDEPAVTAPVTGGLPSRLGWVSAALMTIAFAALAFIHFRAQTPIEHTQRYTITLPENSTVDSFAISPDARYVVIAAAVNGKQQLWLRPLDAVQAQPMPTTEDATYPFWSPDSRYIGFFGQGKLKKIAVNGGSSQSLCDVTAPRGGSWNRDDVILFSPSGRPGGGAIQRVAAAGGVPVDLFKSKGAFFYPVFLPDGRHFLYVDGQLSGKGGIYLSSLDGAENRRILDDRSAVEFAASSSGSRAGYLLFIRQNNLMALPFDTGSLQASGEVFPVAEGVPLGNSKDLEYAPVTVSSDGVLLYANEIAGSLRSNQLVWYDRGGKVLDRLAAPRGVLVPAISPNEKMVAYARVGTPADIWLRDLARATDTRFTTDGTNFAPFWSPTGDRIVFSSIRGGSLPAIYRKVSSGSSQDELLLPSSNDRANQWSRDGRFILYSHTDSKTKEDLWYLPMNERTPGTSKPVPFLQTEFNELHGQLSPDSRWMAYASDESGEREVYVRPFPLGEGKWKISTAGGDQPRWRGDGKELFYAAADGKITVVPVMNTVTGPTPSFAPGFPVPLFESHILPNTAATNMVFQYDVTADGKRFLVTTLGDAPTTPSPPLTVVVNWIAGLKK